MVKNGYKYENGIPIFLIALHELAKGQFSEKAILGMFAILTNFSCTSWGAENDPHL